MKKGGGDGKFLLALAAKDGSETLLPADVVGHSDFSVYVQWHDAGRLLPALETAVSARILFSSLVFLWAPTLGGKRQPRLRSLVSGSTALGQAFPGTLIAEDSHLSLHQLDDLMVAQWANGARSIANTAFVACCLPYRMINKFHLETRNTTTVQCFF